MTPLHRAARVADDGMVVRLLARRADANAFTYRGRAPSNLGVLACLGEADQRRLDRDAVMRTTLVLAEKMYEVTFAGQNQNGNTLWHFMAQRGNKDQLAFLLDWFVQRFGRAALADQLNITNADGKSVKDTAMYNASMRDMVERRGGRNAAPPPAKMPGFKVSQGDHWHRQTRR